MVHIKIIRHSERLDFSNPTYWALCCMTHYWKDSPLTDRGYKMSKQKAFDLRDNNFIPDKIYTSPYNRTLSTATEMKTVFDNCSLEIEPLLAEYQPEDWFGSGHRISLYPNGIPTSYKGNQTIFSYPETMEEFSDRIQFIIQKIIDENENNVLIVTHGEVIKTFSNYIQSKYPDLILDLGTTPYLTILSFDYDKENNIIDKSSVKIN